MPTDNSRAFRRFTRAVFAAQAAVLRHGDTANAPVGQGTARWRVLRAIDDGTHLWPTRRASWGRHVSQCNALLTP